MSGCILQLWTMLQQVSTIDLCHIAFTGLSYHCHEMHWAQYEGISSNHTNHLIYPRDVNKSFVTPLQHCSPKITSSFLVAGFSSIFCTYIKHVMLQPMLTCILYNSLFHMRIERLCVVPTCATAVQANVWSEGQNKNEGFICSHDIRDLFL